MRNPGQRKGGRAAEVTVQACRPAADAGVHAGRRFASAQGSVLMEYVLLCCFTAALVIEFWHAELYNFDTGWKGTLGRGVVDFYQRVLGGIALPVP